MKKIESHPHREALQADLQQQNLYNPFSDDSTAMIREMCNAKQFRKCNALNVIRNSKLAGPRRSASQWRNWHRKTLLQPIQRGITDETSIRLQSRSHNNEPPPPRTRRRTCRTCSLSTVSKVASFFLKFFMVELGHVQKLVELMRIVHFFKKMFVAVGFVYR